MPTRIDATFRNAQDITLDAFRAPAGAPGEFRDMTIQVDGRTFTVSFANPNAPSVRFASYHFFNLIFNGSARTAVKERLDALVTALSERRAYARDVGSAMSVTGFRDNVRQTLVTEREAIAREPDGKMALYGFSNVRESAGLLVDDLSLKDVNGSPVQVLKSQVINDYNAAIGLPGTTDSAALTIAFMRDNDRNRWDYGRGQDGQNVSAADKDAWAAYLRRKDVDLFSKIRRARIDAAAGKRTGWAGEIARQCLLPAIHDLVRKNIDPRLVQENPDVNFVLDAVADSVLEIAETDFGELDRAAIDAKINEIVARRAPSGKAAFAKRVLDNVAMTAFWRQTSKLGLDFFKSRGQTVVFDWTTFDGMHSDGAELADKWWKRGDADVGDHHGVAITNSEMRHLNSLKYAAKPGDGRLLRVEGCLTPEAAAQTVAAKVDEFAALDRETLGRVVANLEAGFAEADASMFIGAAVDLLQALPPFTYCAYIDSNGTVNSPDKLNELCERAFDRVKARIDGTKTPAAKAALIVTVGEIFQAELLKDQTLIDSIADSRKAQANAYNHGVASPLAKRQLAGVDRGFGAKVFFSSRTGEPNELGQALLGAGGEVLDRVGEFRRTVAAALALPEENLFGSPAFLAFVPRVSRETGGNLKKIVAKLGTIRAAADAKAAVDAHIATLVPLTPEAKKVFDRRGSWDLSRLIYNEVSVAMRRGRPIDIERLKRNAEVICDLCTRTVEFTREFARRLNPKDAPELRLTDDEILRLSDAFLDREGSAVNNYRLTGNEKHVAHFDDETATALLQASGLAVGLQTRAHALRQGATSLREAAEEIRTRFGVGDGNPPPRSRAETRALRVARMEANAIDLDTRAAMLTPERLKILAINAVAMRGRGIHGETTLEILRALNAGGPIPTDVGKTSAEKIANFARAFADRIRHAWQSTLLEAAQEDNIGYDDGNTALKMAFAIYLRENPSVKGFLDREADESLFSEVRERLDYENIKPGDPIRNVVDNVLTQGQL